MSTQPELGIRDRAPRLYALINATVVPEAGRTLTNARVLVDDGVITGVGPQISIPDDANVIDMRGKTIYPGLIEPYAEVVLKDEPNQSGHWNKHVRPERTAGSQAVGNDSTEELRRSGFALQVLVPKNGILKGASAIVNTGDDENGHQVVADGVAHHVRLTSPRSSARDYYPNSPMGAVALARQTFYDAEWYASAWRAHENGDGVPRPELNMALQSLARSRSNDELFIFDAPDEQYVGRAHRFAIEFGLNRVAVRGSGHEYELLDAIASMGRPIIVPVNFPKAPHVATPEAARDATLYALMHWYFAPENPSRLRDKKVEILLTSHGLKDKAEFRKRVGKAVKRGLTPDDALYACTMAPAELYGIAEKAGSVAVGKAAHLMITDGDWLDDKTKVVETWVDGQRFLHEPAKFGALAGNWQLSFDVLARPSLVIRIHEDDNKLSGTISLAVDANANSAKATKQAATKGTEQTKKADEKQPTKLEQLEAAFGRLSASFPGEVWNAEGKVRFSATHVVSDDTLIGHILDEAGARIAFVASRLEQSNDEENTKDDPEKDPAAKTFEPLSIEVLHPLGMNGVVESPAAEVVVIQNATVWTCGPAGVLQDASVLIQDGIITAVGKNLNVPENAKRFNARGKHVTPGIIDCHSHMATDGGVNESAQAITAEVRIGDFINAFDMTIYQQLAGGVTTSNILHGSANPIGGQNQVIKLRWGKLPEELKFTEAPQGIKFALGENVKQSNWGNEFNTRYPQSRLGVEQIMRDALLAAEAYQERWKEWRETGKGLPPRRDLELEALAEILDGQRWIHCHSYRQDEILALMRTLESFDITIGSFQHILEGYKVAQEMAEHGAMGSSFSDWWAYKFEVFDAIPYNGAVMHNAGVVVSFNSDDAELGRHLNHEAAKATKYGGVSPEEALKFVTLNPARQLRIDQYVGSIEVGKHADVVIWSDDPLQITSRCEQTWVDGVRYFDLDRDRKTRTEHEQLRQKLIRRVLNSGESTKAEGEKDEMWRDLFPRHDEYCAHEHDD